MILPEEYVIEKFYTFGYQPKHNRYNKTYQCGCPICREGKSLGSKRRCFFIPKNNNIFCHNCGWSSTPYNWVKKVSGLDDQQILNEVSKFDYSKEVSFKDVSLKKEYIASTLPDDCINLFDELQLSFYKDNKIVKECIRLLNERRLFTAVNRPKSLYISLKDKTHKNRLIIPFVDERNEIVFYQSRTVLQQDLHSNPKYKCKLGSDKALYGINNVNVDLNYLFLFEGPINAMFTKNGLAVAGISKGNHNFTPLQEQQLKRFTLMNRIWVLDSQWIDNTSLIKTKKLLEQGERVFIWPEKYGKQLKDFNDICMKYGIDEITPEFIITNSYTHLQGMVLLSQIIKAHSSYAPLSGK